MKLNEYQKDALGDVINILDALGYNRVSNLEELDTKHDLPYIELADILCEILNQDED